MVEKRKSLSTSSQRLGLISPGYPAGVLAGPIPLALQPKVLLGAGAGFIVGYLLAKIL